jgi:hypothetical protein
MDLREHCLQFQKSRKRRLWFGSDCLRQEFMNNRVPIEVSKLHSELSIEYDQETYTMRIEITRALQKSRSVEIGWANKEFEGRKSPPPTAYTIRFVS